MDATPQESRHHPHACQASKELCGSGYFCSIPVDMPVVQHLFIDEERITLNTAQLKKNIGRKAVQPIKKGQTSAATDKLLAIAKALGVALWQLAQPDHRSRVSARLKDEKKLIFRQLPIKDEQYTLQAPNQHRPNRIIPINGKGSICAAVMGKVESFI